MDETIFEAVIYDNYQVLIPKELREKFNLKEGEKLKLKVLSKVKEKKQDIPLTQSKKTATPEV